MPHRESVLLYHAGARGEIMMRSSSTKFRFRRLRRETLFAPSQSAEDPSSSRHGSSRVRWERRRHAVGRWVAAIAVFLSFVMSPLEARSVCPDCSGIWPPEPGTVQAHGSGFANDPGLPSLVLSESLTFADVDGDGKADACAHDGSGIKCFLHSNTGGQYSCGLIGSAVRTAAGFDSTWANTPDHWKTIQYPDIDGDGTADVCGRGNNGIYCATGSAGFSDTGLWLAGFNNATSWDSDPAYWGTIQFPDIDGDEKSDICGRGIQGIWCALSGGEIFFGFEGMEIWSTAFGDGDGWNGDPSLWSTIQFADVDGDGAEDICGRGTAGMYCARSRPLSFDFEAPVLWTSQFSTASGWDQPEYYKTLKLADINGDGKADVCGRGIDGVYCGVSTGTGFLKADELNVATFSNGNGWNQPQRYETISFVDMNGDNRADVCGRGLDGVYCALATPYLTGEQSNFSDLFYPTVQWADDFGDDKNWATQEQYWGTVQPAHVFGTEPGAVICGRSAAGIRCQNPWRMQVVPDYVPECSLPAREPSALGVLKTAVILFQDPSDAGQTPPTEAQIRSQIFTDTNPATYTLNENLDEISFGQVSLAGHANSNGDIFTNAGQPFMASANNMVDVDDEILEPAAGLDPSLYDLIVFWRGASGGAGNNFYDGIPSKVVVSGVSGSGIGGTLLHETIHGVGIDHSNGYDCRDATGAQVPWSSTCTVVEYGNILSQMGTGSGSHPITYVKARLGWYDSTQIVTISPNTVRPFEDTYTLAPATEDTEGILALRVPVTRGVIPDIPPYAAQTELQFYIDLEYRRPGYLQPADETTTGVMLVIAPELYVNHMTMLIDTDATAGAAQPPAKFLFSDAPLDVGDTFTSPELGVDIELLSTSGSGAVVRVALLEDDTDGDGIGDSVDNCPLVPNVNQANQDGDAQGDACDSDDDNDGTPDVSDAFPLDPSEDTDSDGDGVGDNADPCPNDATDDSDGDGSCDSVDLCTGNDATGDTDSDGTCNDFDTDDDGDGYSDAEELAAGSDPLDANSIPAVAGVPSLGPAPLATLVTLLLTFGLTALRLRRRVR